MSVLSDLTTNIRALSQQLEFSRCFLLPARALEVPLEIDYDLLDRNRYCVSLKNIDSFMDTSIV